MKLLTVETDTQGLLKTVLREVKDPTKKKSKLHKMADIMQENDGIGITANQVGLTERMFVFTLNDGAIEFAVNPEINVRFSGVSSEVEGCLSYPDVHKKVRRPKKINVTYHNSEEVVTRTLKGMEARIFMHEMQHCDGKCILSE